MTDTATVYGHIGGAPAVEAAVDGLYERILDDVTLAPYFAGLSIDRLKAHQRAFVAMALGGPERYEGRSMADAHRGLGIATADFAKVVEHLAATLAALGVDTETIATIAAALAPLRPQIVSGGHRSS